MFTTVGSLVNQSWSFFCFIIVRIFILAFRYHILAMKSADFVLSVFFRIQSLALDDHQEATKL